MKAAHLVCNRWGVMLLMAPLIPLLATAASLLVNDVGSWASIPASSRRGLMADALLYCAGTVIVAAPLAGVAIARSDRPDRQGRTSAAWAAAWGFSAVVFVVMVSAALRLAAVGLDANAMRVVATSHATLGAVALALAAFGAFCGTAFGDPLDAAACSLSIVLVAAGGLLVAGAALTDVPRPFVEFALTASPLVAIASAAQIDIVRMSVPYQMSPLAHMQVAYPTWQAACAWYLALAAFCFAGFWLKLRTSSPLTAS